MGWVRSDAVSAGQHTRLWARVIVLERGGQKMALVAEDLGGIPGGMLAEAAERASDLGFSQQNVLDSASHTHSGPTGFFNFSTFNTRLHDHQLADGLPAHRRPRSAALHLHGPPPGAGDPPRRRQPRAREARLGEDPDHRPHRQPLRGGSPSKPRHPRGVRRGKRRPGPAGPPAHARPRRQRAPGRQDDRRAPGAGGDVVDVRRPRHRGQTPVHLLQPRPPRRGHPAGRGRDPPRRPGARRPGGGERLRQHRRGRPDRRAFTAPGRRRPTMSAGSRRARSCAPGARRAAR